MVTPQANFVLNMTTVIFAHGKESGPWGSKIRHLGDIAARLGARVISPDYSDLASPEDRVARLLALPRSGHEIVVLVGSSMGGYVSTLASQTLKPKGLFLMAPAVYMPGYADQQPMSGAEHTCVVFGRQDEVIPVENGMRFAAENRADLHVIEGDHRLNEQIEKVGVLFEAFLRRLGVDQFNVWFQTPQALVAIARPYIGRTFHRLFARFEAWNKPDWTPRKCDLEGYQSTVGYGDVQVQFWNGGDLTLTINTGRDGMGGPPIAALRLSDRSIPQLYAERDALVTHDRSADRYCRYFPLHWPQLIQPGLLSENRRDILREVWVMEGSEQGMYELFSCICGIALKFVRETEKDGPIGASFLGVSFDHGDEDSWRTTWIRDDLPPPVATGEWKKLLG